MSKPRAHLRINKKRPSLERKQTTRRQDSERARTLKTWVLHSDVSTIMHVSTTILLQQQAQRGSAVKCASCNNGRESEGSAQSARLALCARLDLAANQSAVVFQHCVGSSTALLLLVSEQRACAFASCSMLQQAVWFTPRSEGDPDVKTPKAHEEDEAHRQPH